MIRHCHYLYGMIFLLSSVYVYAYDYDLIVIGGGLSGIQSAKTALEFNKKIAVVEQSEVVSNHLLIDFAVKTLGRIGMLGYQFRMACEANVGTLIPDLFKRDHILGYIRQVVKSIQQNYVHNLLDDQRITVLYGQASFIDNHTVCIGDVTVTAEKFIIATGKKKKILPNIPGIEYVHCLGSTSFFDQDIIPASIIILGCDSLAVEIACALASLGIKVTMIIKYGLLLPTFDYEMVEMLNSFMQKIGIVIETDTTVLSVKKDGLIMVQCEDQSGNKKTMKTHSIFVAQNSEPNVTGLGLENIGVLYNKKGILVDHTLQTSVDNIYACGDVTHCSDQLTRIADYQAKVAGHNVFCPYWKHAMCADYVHASRMVFSTIPLASVGLTEQEAIKKYGNELMIYRIPYAQIDRAYIDNTTCGMGKFICNKDGILVGAHIFGECAGELVDSVIVGKALSDQCKDYLFELRTPPSYFDLVWFATEESRMRSAKKESFLHYLWQALQGYFSRER